MLRGDTDFSQTEHLDRWHEPGDVSFRFGYDSTARLQEMADGLPETGWKPLQRPPKNEVRTEPRRKPVPVRQSIVEACRFKDIRTVEEWVAEMPYRPIACRHTYRMIILRKTLEVTLNATKDEPPTHYRRLAPPTPSRPATGLPAPSGPKTVRRTLVGEPG